MPAAMLILTVDSRGLAWVSAVSQCLAQNLDEYTAGAQCMVLAGRIMIPKDVHTLISRNCEYYLAWQRRIKIADENKSASH